MISGQLTIHHEINLPSAGVLTGRDIAAAARAVLERETDGELDRWELGDRVDALLNEKYPGGWTLVEGEGVGCALVAFPAFGIRFDRATDTMSLIENRGGAR